MPGEQFRFEREDAQHMVGAAPDFLHAIGAPRPDGGAHEMHRAHTARLQVGFEIKVEIWRVNADEHVGSFGGQQALLQLREHCYP